MNAPGRTPAAAGRPGDSRTNGLPRVAVIGAGFAGLACARTLADHGREVVVFDKGRGPGGRSATRRAAPFAFDHGAQYFTARDARFRRRVDEWIEAGVVARWEGRIVALEGGVPRPLRGDEERFVGVPGMNAVPGRLAGGLDVRRGVRVEAPRRVHGRWHLTAEGGAPLGAFERLVVTAPAPQAAELLHGLTPLAAPVAALDVRPCVAVLVGFGARHDVPFDGAFCDAGPLSWIARDSSKPGRPDAEAWVLHASPAWSQAHFDDPAERAIDALLTAFEHVTGAALPPVEHRDRMRWRHSTPTAPLDAGRGGALFDRQQGLVLAGDAYHGARVEGAFLSGLVAAEELLGDDALAGRAVTPIA